MANFQVQRALLSAKWEIEAGYGLRHLSRFLMESDAPSGQAPATKEALSYLDLRTGGRLISSQLTNANGDFDSEAEAGSLIAHIIMSGPMMMDGDMCSYGVRDTINLLRMVEADPRVGGVLFEVDSGGGESESGTELQNALSDMSKPVAVYTQMLASAALRGTLSADAVYAAHASTDIGSIGSYISFDREILAEIQETIGYIYAEQSTEKNADFRALLEGDESLLQRYVSAGAQAFIDDVERMRPGMTRTAAEKKSMQAGALFPASDAARMGLINGVATYGQVVQILAGVIRQEREQTRAYSRNPQGKTMNSRPGIFRSVASALGLGETSIPSSQTQNTEDVNETETQATAEAADQTQVDSLVAYRNELTELKSRLDELATTVKTQEQTIATQAETLTKAETERKTLNETIAKLKVGNSGDVSNGKQADRKQFETAERVDKATSKY